MRSILITGGTRGIGRALVEEFLNNGDRVALLYKNSEDTAEELEKRGAHAFRCDLEKIDEIEGLLQSVRTSFGDVDILINNAGVSSFSLFTDLTTEEWQRVRSIDLDAPLLITKYLLPPMISKKYGRILYISSMWGQVGSSCEAAYSTAKAGLLGLTKALAKELGPSGITVNCVCPGVIDTEMNDCLDEETRASLREETPLMRFGKAAEVAKLCTYLSSEDASFITGQIIGINGGFVIT